MFHPQIIAEIISLVANKEKHDLIFSYSKKNYDLHQFNVGSLYPKDVKKMNQSLKRRYKHQEISILPTSWNQGERRLFVWFIICFLYQKKIKIENITQQDLKSLSLIFYGKDTIFLDFQLRNLPKVTKSKRSWSSEEDELLKRAIKTLKVDLDDSKVFNNWNDVAKIIFFQTERRIFRTPKSCRQRWYNHLDESKKKDQFSVQEDLLMINYILKESKSWSKIVKVMNYSRTEHRIKNRFYTLIRKYQRSAGRSESDELNDEEEREVVLKLKAMLEAKRNTQLGLEQISNQSRMKKSPGVKMEQQSEELGQPVVQKQPKYIKNQKSAETHKIKTQTDYASFESDLKLKIKEQELQPRSENSSTELKQSHNDISNQPQDSKAVRIVNDYWAENCAPYAQYGYCINFATQQVLSSPQMMANPIIVNQFYCPIYFHTGMEYQFFRQ